ncbi:hypothetical protein ACFOZ0_02775 [Streptomyces yaanensis]|uniref:Secreted protein n=1 Tax=Streptomyces yaanensis TaxID=1142239 RepID=A0ABV7S7A2_9ACTN|nr:hypothetical protein [Streptomyces sp. CGMCC 4.7035]WNB99804.1 hypothetical protein Q2K21_17990 [Streptomyces sp. CGMCC 4.7035]
MISTRRIVAAVGLAVGVTGLAAPLASAAAADTPDAGRLNPVTLLDSLARSGVPAEHRDEIPGLSGQLGGLNQLHDLNQLHQATDLVAPVTGLLPAVQT